jgi:hypothetical protein
LNGAFNASHDGHSQEAAHGLGGSEVRLTHPRALLLSPRMKNLSVAGCSFQEIAKKVHVMAKLFVFPCGHFGSL